MSEYTTTIDFDPNDAGGAALLVGFAVSISIIYAQDPAGALEVATSSVGATVYFVVLPALGFVTGIYTLAGGPYTGIPLFCLGSYLGVFGVGVAFGTLAAASPSVQLLIGGIALVALAVVAIIASLRRLFGWADVGLPGRSVR